MRLFTGFALSLLLAAASPAWGQEARLGEARAILEGDILTLETGRIVRSFEWNDGWLIGQTIGNPATGATWRLTGEEGDLSVPGEAMSGGRLALDTVAATRMRPAYLRVTIETGGQALQAKRICELTPGAPAISCTLALKGQPPSDWGAAEASASDGIEIADEAAASQSFVTERLTLPGRHWRAQAVAFVPVTDDHDTLVHHRNILLYRQDVRLAGNILRLEERPGGEQIFILKESPAGADQLGWPGHDFLARINDIRVAGSGFEASDIRPDVWTKAYAVTVGVAAPGRRAFLESLRAYRETRRTFIFERDAMLLSNTWGDRSRDSRMTEAFMLAEIDAAAVFGTTHVQLDDGWQAGLSRNSASSAGERWEDWSAEDWLPHPERFPNGLGPIIERARERGVEIGLWFNPSRANDYRHWRRDADILIGYWRRHGISTVKIDGIEVPTKRAERNLRAFLERVTEATGGEMVFNMDVTAGRRPGYHFMTEYGNIFLENRYTDWGNYYPHRTLRNLWMLAAYVPPQFLQIEFLNLWRNADQYPADDPLAPSRIPFDYAFAATMAAQPLAWMEVSNLPPEADSIGPAFDAYLDFRADWQAGRVFPVGSEPNGGSWTGFQSIADDRSGYLIVFREALASSATGRVDTLLVPGRETRFEPVFGAAQAFASTPEADGAVTFALPQPSSFAVYRYRQD